MKIRTFLVAICNRHTHEVVEWLEVQAIDWKGAIWLVFDIRRYDSTNYYGEAIEI